MGTIDIKTLLKNYIEEKRGDVIDEKGEIVGYHEGVTFYTIGERHGFVITKKGTEDTPYFVVAKDLEKNTVTVAHTPPSEKNGTTIIVDSPVWNIPLVEGSIYEARARYRAPLAQVKVINGTHFEVVSGTMVATSGQSLVLYDTDLCIGGGILK